jgi:hypothetical protein
LPGYNPHPLTGKQKCTWSVWVSGYLRATFQFDGGVRARVNGESSAGVAAKRAAVWVCGGARGGGAAALVSIQSVFPYADEIPEGDRRDVPDTGVGS